jgi:Xaa-Pro aminopeptidase
MMMDEAEIRIPRRISIFELERRWKAVRLGMKERGLDFLLIQNSTDYIGGYVKWFTDLPAVHNYPSTVIFPRDGEMTTIWSGPRPPLAPHPPAWSLHGVRKRISVPIIPSLGYSTIFDAEKVVEELTPHRKCHVGLVGMGLMSAAFYKYVVEHLSAAIIEDATDLVDGIKGIKSNEEIGLIREACEIQDAAFEYALTRIQPGRKDLDVFADVKHKCMELGSEQQLIIGGSAPAGTKAPLFHTHFGNRVIRKGDQFNLLIESNGPSGFYGHILRIVCLGETPPELGRQFELAQKAQKVSLNLLKPGTDPETIWDANNEFLRSHGYREETRVFAHGQGYDLVERPSLNPGETMKIKAKMNIAVHPAIVTPKAFATVCENYLTSELGKYECMHKTPQKIFVI